MAKPKKYELRTLADVQAVVTRENLHAFVQDFSMWLVFHNEMKNLNPAVKLTDPDVFKWVDDGKIGMSKLTIEIQQEK